MDWDSLSPSQYRLWGSCVGVTVGAVISETSVIRGASVPELVIISRVAVSEEVVVVLSEMFVTVGAVGLEMSVFVEGWAVADSTSELELRLEGAVSVASLAGPVAELLLRLKLELLVESILVAGILVES